MTRPTLTGIKGIKIPVSDLEVSLRWYGEVFGATPYLEFPDEDGVVSGVGCTLPGMQEAIGLREEPDHVKALAGFNPVVFRVPDQDAVEAWMTHLDGLGVRHSPLIEASIGYMVVFDDPDGIEIHIYSDTGHGRDYSDRPGYGRRVSAG